MGLAALLAALVLLWPAPLAYTQTLPPDNGDGTADSSAGSSESSAGGVIPAGQDLFRTIGAQVLFGIHPIPADFFGPGSQPFAGAVPFCGDPIDPASLWATDTIVERLGDADLPGSGSTATVDIELVALSLRSCEPITVHTEGQPGSLWDVDVTLGRKPGAPGTVDFTEGDPGFFQAEFNVQPLFTFTRVDDPREVRVLEDFPAVQLHMSDPVPFSPLPPPGLTVPPPSTDNHFFPLDDLNFTGAGFDLRLQLTTRVIPEPATLSLLSVGLLALLRRKRHRPRQR